jgi:type III restriction enzyme
MLGKKPTKDLAASGQRPMLGRIKSLKDLIVLNDEAHHVHQEDLEWTRSLLAAHVALPRGLSLWLDFSATPKDQNGMYFPWTVCDYPLAQAVEDRIVKAPLIVTNEDDSKQPAEDPDEVTKDNVTEKYGYWIRAAVLRWKEHYKVYKKLGTRPVLFIMAEKSAYADAIGEYLWKTREFGFKESEVLVIHTDTAGEITKKDLEKAREAARDVDNPEGKIKVIVSVMMLREGWDVRNVSVVLGLRPFTAKAEILPEQVIGRGLRLMARVSPDRTQTLEVLGTRNLLKVLREQLEAEGVGIGSTKAKDPPVPVIIEPLQERLKYDIQIPITKPSLIRNARKLSDLDLATLGAIYEREELEERFRVRLKLDFATTETEVHQADVAAGELPTAQELLASISNKVIDRVKLTNCFADVYPIVREYVATRCFGKQVDLENEELRSHLARLELQEGIAKYLAREIGSLTVERHAIEFDNAEFKLSDTRPFSWRRNLPPLEAAKTVFNYVATYNDFERRFAQFLEKAKDVRRFAALGTTEQGESGSQFRVDYLKSSGAIGFYYPDWVVVQKTGDREVNWIIETKGRVWDGTDAKDEAIRIWCERVTSTTRNTWRYARVDQVDFDRLKASDLRKLLP